jgi:hypothetical protein
MLRYRRVGQTFEDILHFLVRDLRKKFSWPPEVALMPEAVNGSLAVTGSFANGDPQAATCKVLLETAHTAPPSPLKIIGGI